MSTYRKLPVEVEAIQLGGKLGRQPLDVQVQEFTEFMGDAHYEYDEDGVYIDTLEGIMYAQTGAWIIRGVKGEFYPCKPDIFAATYEPVESSP